MSENSNDGPGLHFDRAEFDARAARVRAEMTARGLDALLLFAPESQYWLTGYDTFGFCFFQCLVWPRDGAPVLLTRSADLRQARATSTVTDIRVWRDGAAADPARDLVAVLAERGLLDARLGVETDTHGLTGRNLRRLDAAFADAGASPPEPADGLIGDLRLVKSPAEIACARRAADLSDAAYRAARPAMRAGRHEAEVFAALQGAIFAAGGDDPANPIILGSGPVTPGVDTGAHLCRYYSGRRRLADGDQLTLEWSGVWRHYHAPMMRTTPIGRAAPEHVAMHAAARSALLACEAAMVPGRTFGDVFAAHADALDAAGYDHARLNACGYAVGARFAPSWMEHAMFYEGAPTIVAPGMTLFAHMILMDTDSGAAMCLGRTSLVAETGAAPLSALPLDLDVGGDPGGDLGAGG